jgi:hypothetical protein
MLILASHNKNKLQICFVLLKYGKLLLFEKRMLLFMVKIALKLEEGRCSERLTLAGNFDSNKNL